MLRKTQSVCCNYPHELCFGTKRGKIKAKGKDTIKAHIPHPKNKKTFFGYFKDDGLFNRKTKGRFDYDKKWESIKDNWLSLYVNNEEQVGFSKTKKVTADDEWCSEAYMETDYSILNKNDFQNVLEKYIAFDVLNGD